MLSCDRFRHRWLNTTSSCILCYHRIKPAYGHEKLGMTMPYANSLDTPGVLCNYISDGMEVLRSIDGQDENDATSMPSSREMDQAKSLLRV